VPLADPSGEPVALEDLPRAPLLEDVIATVRPTRQRRGSAPLG